MSSETITFPSNGTTVHWDQNTFTGTITFKGTVHEEDIVNAREKLSVRNSLDALSESPRMSDFLMGIAMVIREREDRAPGSAS